MIAIIYKHNDENYTALVDGYITKVDNLNNLDAKKIWVTNIEVENINRENIKNISFFGSTFGEIINHFGYRNLSTFHKLSIVQKTINKIIEKIEIEHRIKLTIKRIEGMGETIVDFYKIKIPWFDTKIEKSNIKSVSSDINIDLSKPRTKNYNISYTSRYAILNKIKDIIIPVDRFTTLKNEKQLSDKSFNIYMCNIKPKQNIKNIKKAIIFKDLIGENKILIERELKLVSDVYDVDIINIYSYSKNKKIDIGLELNKGKDSFAEEIYSNLIINKIKSVSPFLSMYLKKIEREYIYNDLLLLDSYESIRVISISNNKFIVERDFNYDINLNKVKSIINLNISLIIKT